MPVCQPLLADYLSTCQPLRWNSVQFKRNGGTHGEELKIRIKDFQAYKNASLILANTGLSPEDVLMRGHFFAKTLRSGLNIHCSNSFEEHAFSSYTSQKAGLSCIFFLQGKADIQVGEQTFSLKPTQGQISSVGLIRKQEEPFRRTTQQSQNVQHLVISASSEWLAHSGFESSLDIKLKQQFCLHNMAFQQWQANQRLAALVYEILKPGVLQPELLDLYLEARAIDVITETLSHLIQTDTGQVSTEPKLSKHDVIRLQRAQDFILANPAQNFSVESIACEAGISISGLQRLFRRTKGCSVFDYIRNVRMNEAMSLLRTGELSVEQVSYFVGYKSPANFATAFKRQFGLTPKEVAKPLSISLVL